MKKLFPIVAFIAVALVSLAMGGFAYYATQEAARIKFEAAADDALNRIGSRVDLHLSLLRAAKGLFIAGQENVPAKVFETFFQSLDVATNFGGLHGMGFVTLVKSGDEARVEREISAILGEKRAIHPPTALPWRAPVVLLEPLEPENRAVVGFDMMSNPIRREVIENAMKDDALHASARLLMGKDTGAARNFVGFLVFVRLPPQKTPDGREAPTAGLLYNAFKAHDLFQIALAKAPLLPVNVEVYDGAPGHENLMFRSETPPSSSLGEALVTARTIQVAGREWTILFRPTSAFSVPSSRGIPVMLGLFGLLLAGAIALVARYQERAYDAVSQLHETTEKSLLEKDLMLQEMKHRIKNLIARVLAIARQTASGATDINEFAASFSARLQAMAASQDMLTRSRWQKADLRDLLRIELGQVFGNELPDGLLSGPQVLLNETATQALGLTFHELATNALKYGEAGNSVGALRISWDVEGPRPRRVLVLHWRESGKVELKAPDKTGFGTRLIDMNITRELQGAIERDYCKDGLKVTIRIPYD